MNCRIDIVGDQQWMVLVMVKLKLHLHTNEGYE